LLDLVDTLVIQRASLTGGITSALLRRPSYIPDGGLTELPPTAMLIWTVPFGSSDQRLTADI